MLGNPFLAIFSKPGAGELSEEAKPSGDFRGNATCSPCSLSSIKMAARGALRNYQVLVGCTIGSHKVVFSAREIFLYRMRWSRERGEREVVGRRRGFDRAASENRIIVLIFILLASLVIFARTVSAFPGGDGN